MRCPSCGSKNTKQVKRDHRFVESGLSNVTLRGCTFVVCSDCGDEGMVLKRPAHLMQEILRKLVFKSGPLLPEEIRFLRKSSGWTNKQVAAYIGVSEEQASRWSTGSGKGERMSAAAEALFRAIVYVESMSGEELQEAHSRVIGLLTAPKNMLQHKRKSAKPVLEKIVLAA